MLPSRGSIRGLFGLLLTVLLAVAPASADEPDSPPLRLLVLGADAGGIVASKKEGVDDAAVPALTSRQGRALTAGFVGRPIDDDLLADIREQLSAYYAGISRPFVDISFPVQDFAGGTLRVSVVETKLGRVTVEGNRWFDAGQYTGAVRSLSGAPIDLHSLAADTDWVNRIDQRHATMMLRPTDDPMTFDLDIAATDSVPLLVTLAADNGGTPETGLYETAIGLDWTNAFWRGDDLSYGFVISPDNSGTRQHTVSYTTFLPWRDTMTVSAITADGQGRVAGSPDGMAADGHSDIVSWRYGVLLPASPMFIQHVDFGYDFKSTNTNVLNGGATVFPGASELDQFVLGVAARRDDVLGWTAVTASWVGSPGNLTPRNTRAALSAQRAGASASYVYGRVSIERLTSLPYDAAWSARLTAQFSSANLLPSEQLVFGGAQSIRGFADVAATRDEGVLTEHELRFPALAPSLPPELPEAGPMVPFVFVDAGAGRDHLVMAGFRRSWLEMLSAGPGLAWQVTPTAALRFSWGFPLIRNGHFGSFLGPQFGTLITF